METGRNFSKNRYKKKLLATMKYPFKSFFDTIDCKESTREFPSVKILVLVKIPLFYWFLRQFSPFREGIGGSRQDDVFLSKVE